MMSFRSSYSLLILLVAGVAHGEKPFPRMQVIPLPDYQASFQRDGVEVARYFFSPTLKRPFLYPVIGPSGRPLTRMGHPHDPETHSHHNSVWVAHQDVNGVNFWEDKGGGRIVHQKVERFDDGDDAGSCVTTNAWLGADGKPLMTERRTTTIQALEGDELLITLDLQFEAKNGDVTFGKTPFGLVGVRMAKTVGVNDGGGVIRNSEGAVDEPKILWKHAKWVDYSGPVSPGVLEGITLMDHPSNPNHPTGFHVRRDGWMGESLTLDGPRTLRMGETLRVRYGLYVHSGAPGREALMHRWALFAGAPQQQPAAAPHADQQYDLLIKNGHVIDAKNHLSAIRDVAIKDHKIAAVAANIPAERGFKVIDARGLYVTPGLVDMHVHVYTGTGQKNAYSGDLSVAPDGFTFRCGVTTVVDAGSSGWRNFPDFKDRIIDRSKTRVLAMLNIVGKGMGGGLIEQDVQDMDAKATAQRAKEYPLTVVGIKTAHYTGPDWVAVDRAVEAGTIAHVPVMVDFGNFVPERPYQDLVLKHLRPGDISTHMYLDFVPLLDDNGKLLPYVFEARKRGVIFDLGHGAGSFVFRQAAPAMKQGFGPDSISTDLHVSSMNSGMKDMMSVMSKMLNLGETIDQVIAQSTWNPAREIHREELGNLDVGADADVAILRVEHGNYGFTDSFGARMKGTQRLVTELTVRDGLMVWDLNGISREDYGKLGPKYRPQGDNRWDGTINSTVRGRR